MIELILYQKLLTKHLKFLYIVMLFSDLFYKYKLSGCIYTMIF